MDDISNHRMDVREFMARPPFNRKGLSEQELSLLCAALTHDSFSSEALNLQPPVVLESYERLEFLGDSVLEFIACEHIYLNSELKEGKMTDFKQEIVANKKISDRILEKGLGIDNVMLVGHGHRGPKGNIIEENMRADSFEALIGAIYLLYGMDEAKRIAKDILI